MGGVSSASPPRTHQRLLSLDQNCLTNLEHGLAGVAAGNLTLTVKQVADRIREISGTAGAVSVQSASAPGPWPSRACA